MAAAQIADQVLQASQAKAAEEQQDQANADPDFQLASRGLDIQQASDEMDHVRAMAEIERKIRKDAVDEVDDDLDRAMKLIIAKIQAASFSQRGGNDR